MKLYSNSADSIEMIPFPEFIKFLSDNDYKIVKGEFNTIYAHKRKQTGNIFMSVIPDNILVKGVK